MNIPIQGFTVTPVVSLPQVSVIVFVIRGSPIFAQTGYKASRPIPAAVPTVNTVTL